MKKYIAGSFDIEKGKEMYYTNTFDTFYHENDIKLGKEELEDWALCLNSPWSIADERYVIEYNYIDAYTAIPKDVPQFRCKYITVGYDGITAEIFGYGEHVEDALKHCKEQRFKIQREYNPNDESC